MDLKRFTPPDRTPVKPASMDASVFAAIEYLNAHARTVVKLAGLPAQHRPARFGDLVRWVRSNRYHRLAPPISVLRLWIEAYSEARAVRLPIDTAPLHVPALFALLERTHNTRGLCALAFGPTDPCVLRRAFRGAWFVLWRDLETHFGRIETDGHFHTDKPRPDSITHQSALARVRWTLGRWNATAAERQADEALRAAPGVVAVVHDEIIMVSDDAPTPGRVRLHDARAAMGKRERANAIAAAADAAAAKVMTAARKPPRVLRDDDNTPAHPIDPDAWVWVALDGNVSVVDEARSVRWAKD
ncbi:MAG: hypothetical protein ACOYB0_08375 [Polynucleobacter sp.]